jgi:hypothetical protein
MPDPQMSLDDLHFLLGHYARQLFDAQKQRIMAGNRVAAMERDGLGAYAEPAKAVVAEYEAIERGINRELTRYAKQHFMRSWIEDQRGIDLPGFARLLGVTGNIDRFPTVSKLWKYLGLHVVDGHAPRREKGVAWTHTDCQFWHLRACKPECRTDHHPSCIPNGVGTAYAPQGQVVCHQLGESISKAKRKAAPEKNGPYQLAYIEKRRYYLQDRERSGPSMCPAGQTHKSKKTGRIISCVKPSKDPEDDGETSAHVHQMAMRFAVKELIRNLWREWHAQRGHTISVGPYGGVVGNPPHYQCSCSIDGRGHAGVDTRPKPAAPDPAPHDLVAV